MTPARLNYILQNPSSISDKEIETLQTIITDFPFFSLPHILLSKVYHQKDDYRYENQLKKASLRSSNREWLYNYINNNIDFEAENKIEEEIIEKEEVAAETNIAIQEDNSINEVEIKEEIPTEIEEEISQAEIEETTEQEQEKIVETEEETIEGIDIEPEIEEIVSDSFETEITEVEPDNISENIEEIIEEEEEIETKETFEEDTNKNEEQAIEQSEKETIVAQSFTSWLDKFSSSKKSKKEETEDIKLEENELLEIKESEPINQEETSIPETKLNYKSSTLNTKKSIDIIDSFLQKNPRIKQPKTDFFKAETAAMFSLDIENIIVTETLAELYVKQGHTKQAIWAYEKLKLKYPQKETYFATLINELKKDKE